MTTYGDAQTTKTAAALGHPWLTLGGSLRPTMDIVGIEPSAAKQGTLVLVFKKIVWTPDKNLIDALQKEKVVGPFKWVARAMNTKVLALPWIVPGAPPAAQAQHEALASHAELAEARGLPMPELGKFFLDDDGKKAPYLDGGELTVAMARANPERLADVMTYLRTPQRADWFMDALAEVARATKKAADRALIYDAIAEMPVPPKSNAHRKTYVDAVNEGAAAFRAAKDAINAERLGAKAALLK